MKKPRAIEVAIDAVVLDGVDAGDPARFEAALTRALGRLLGAHDGRPSWRFAAQPSGEAPPPVSAVGAEAWGEAVAAHVHTRLTAPPPGPSLNPPPPSRSS